MPDRLLLAQDRQGRCCPSADREEREVTLSSVSEKIFTSGDRRGFRTRDDTPERLTKPVR